MSIRIIIADNHEVIRQGISLLIEQQEDMEIIAQAQDGRQAVRFARDTQPDMVLLEISIYWVQTKVECRGPPAHIDRFAQTGNGPISIAPYCVDVYVCNSVAFATDAMHGGNTCFDGHQ